jgi:S-adenosyl-L-methionine hydrolase (adenosine-forming)
MYATITLTTDFGLSDVYVACVKGIILRINPDAKIVDISHSVQPQNILQGAFLLHTAYKYFPDGTIHIVVIDPGVGSGRGAIILKTPSAYFLAPDNGLLSYIVDEYQPLPSAKSFTKDAMIQPVNSGTRLEVFAISHNKFWQTPVSPTFHARDIFAPVAAHLSMGVSLNQIGKPIDGIQVLPLPKPDRDTQGNLVGQILHIDTFGNLITNLCERDLDSKEIVAEINNQFVTGIKRFYEEAKGLSIITGSFGYLEISLPGGSAAAVLKAKLGDRVKLVSTHQNANPKMR